MRGHSVTIWLMRIAILVVLVATLFTTQVTAVSAHSHSDAPLPVCEQLADDVDEICFEQITLTPLESVQPPVPPQPAPLVVLRLSPVIFQPPEAA